MLQNILLTFYRVTIRHPLYAALNLLGLSFGIAVFITLSLYAHFESSFESWLPDADKIYDVATTWILPGRPVDQTPASMGGLLEQLHEDYPDLVGTRILGYTAIVHLGADVVHEKEQLVDPDFFKLFDLPLVAGEKAGALEPGRLMLTESMARKYFGRSNVVGETLRLSDDEGPRTYTISAVLRDLPRNTERNFDFVRLLTPESHKLSDVYWAHWGSTSLTTFLRFETPAEAKRLEAGLDDFVDRKAASEARPGQLYHTALQLRLLKLRALHLRDKRSAVAVVTLALVGLLSFLVAAINFINLSTARAGIRAREVAVRRTLGATPVNLRVQFLGEALLMTLAAALAGLSIVELLLPVINAAGGLDLSLDYRHQGGFLAAMMGGVLLLGLLSGLYPAFVLSAFQPAQVLASSRSPAGGRFGMRVREVLVIVQFAVVIAFFVLTWGFERQISHMQNADLGFRRSGLFVMAADDPAMNAAAKQAAKTALEQVPGVTLVGFGTSAPGDESLTNGGNIKLPGDTGAETNLTYSAVGPNYFTTYGATLLAGRFLDEAHGDETIPDDTTTTNIVVSRKAMGELGIASPEEALGKTAYQGGKPLQIVGVVETMQFRSPKGETLPMFYYFHRELKTNQLFAVRYVGVPEAEMRRRLTDAWRSAVPEVPPTLVTADENLDRYYKPDRNRSNLFGAGALVAALVGCIGLYGMAAFTASRRMLEVAVRKVLGASRKVLVSLLVGSFLRPVLIANVIAVPVAYLVLRNWLVQFNDRIAMSPVPFLVGGGTAILVAATTVGMLAWNAANSEPGRALRHE
jgi:putative ABC transport system permease protein